MGCVSKTTAPTRQSIDHGIAVFPLDPELDVAVIACERHREARRAPSPRTTTIGYLARPVSYARAGSPEAAPRFRCSQATACPQGSGCDRRKRGTYVPLELVDGPGTRRRSRLRRRVMPAMFAVERYGDEHGEDDRHDGHIVMKPDPPCLLRRLCVVFNRSREQRRTAPRPRERPPPCTQAIAPGRDEPAVEALYRAT